MIQIAIIGGGASGIMCAATILEILGKNEEYCIHLFEKNTLLGKKVRISGGGRCNVTTGIEKKKEILEKYTRGSDFFEMQYGKFSVGATKKWFESYGLALKCEDDNRVFPVSDNSSDVLRVFESIFEKYPLNIKIHFSATVESISSSFPYQITLKSQEKVSFGDFDYIVLSAGGNAYSQTGSSGDGYSFARSLGHKITSLGPSLSSFETKESWLHELSGMSFEKATLKDTEKKYYCHGPLLCTHFGFSGPCAFYFSSQCAFETIQPNHPLKILLIPLTGWGYEDWDRFLQQACQERGIKEVHTLLKSILPKRFVESISNEMDWKKLFEKQASQLSREERKKIAKLFGEGIPFTLLSRRAGDEFVTAGGICREEFTETNTSKIQDRIFACGELLDVDGVTGGFNLQWAWTSGRNAGKALAERVQKEWN